VLHFLQRFLRLLVLSDFLLKLGGTFCDEFFEVFTVFLICAVMVLNVSANCPISSLCHWCGNIELPLSTCFMAVIKR